VKGERSGILRNQRGAFLFIYLYYSDWNLNFDL